MGDVRINIRPAARSANIEALYVIVNDSFIDMSTSDCKPKFKKIKKGKASFSAILVRNDGSSEAATACLEVKCGERVLLADFTLEVPADQELARKSTSFDAD
jgi:hypothetical protein